jgi:hypothetical protein
VIDVVNEQITGLKVISGTATLTFADHQTLTYTGTHVTVNFLDT